MDHGASAGRLYAVGRTRSLHHLNELFAPLRVIRSGFRDGWLYKNWGRVLYSPCGSKEPRWIATR